MIIDDALKNREEAESQVIRDKQWDWLTSTAMTRIEPGGSVIVNATRWHDDDLIGRIMEGQAGPGWEFINLPALVDETTGSELALWPERWPLSELQDRRRLVGEYDWTALYMGEPRPKGGRLFKEPVRYTAWDPDGWQFVIGCDPAATEKTSADYSAIVVLAFRGRPLTTSHECRVAQVWRGQVGIPDLVKVLDRMSREWGAAVAVEAVGGFKAVPQMLREVNRNLRIFDISPSTDKFIRAQPVAAAWNDGRVLVPVRRSADWVDPFVAEVCKFTGVKDPKDDQVDALSHAFTACAAASPHTRGFMRPGWREI
jgi:predicted phage terminase large subunit-like protein